MADNPEREKVTLERIVLTNTYQFEALLNVLERKGILTSKEVLDEMEAVVLARGKDPKKIN